MLAADVDAHVCADATVAVNTRTAFGLAHNVWRCAVRFVQALDWGVTCSIALSQPVVGETSVGVSSLKGTVLYGIF